MTETDNLHSAAHAALMCCDPAGKVAAVRAFAEKLAAGELRAAASHSAERIEIPGRPAQPELVSPRMVPRRRLGSPAGRAALYHAISHIEFNAINLALDALYRFPGMPDDYYRDWTRVAVEEALHFELMAAHLESLGSYYGELPAHNGLWEMALKTDFDVMVRMALVPRVLEARGLDVTPGIMQRVGKAGDSRAVEILDIIQRDEVGHVAIGNRWFRHECELRGLEPRATFRNLLREHTRGYLSGPFDEIARLQAGFTRLELDDLIALEREFNAQMDAEGA
jgi:uncharacterized ferritin-like protein (DUF455 family)